MGLPPDPRSGSLDRCRRHSFHFISASCAGYEVMYEYVKLELNALRLGCKLRPIWRPLSVCQ